MANEYLKRTPTSTGNRKVWTWSGWVKISGITAALLTPFGAYRTGTSQGDDIFFRTGTGGAVRFTSINSSSGSGYVGDIVDTAYKRDNASWLHVMAVANTTAEGTTEKWHLYINGVRITDTTNNVYPTDNYQTNINNLVQHYIGDAEGGDKGQISDAFFVDGQALTPDVFGYYKKGDGYISAGSTQATDFKKGQWVPKAPKVIKSVINARGGFGVNGFYLPMNDDSNFGADFHCEPNSIIKLKGEDFNEYPQPRNGAPTTTDAYVSQLREDPYAANLVLAVPGIALENTNTELVTNGTFDTGISGWTGYDSTPTWDNVNQRLAIDAPTEFDGVQTSSGISVSANTNYTLSLDVFLGTAGGVRLQVRNSANSGGIVLLDVDASGAYVLNFNSGANTSVYIRLVTTGGNTGTAYFDNISLKEAIPVRDYSADIKGSGTNKTLTGNGGAGIAAIPSYYGSALSFDGTDDYFTIPNNSDFYFGGDFTVECWIYRNVTSTSEAVVGVFENSSARRSWQMETRGSSGFRFQWWSDGSTGSQIDAPSNGVPGNQWNHVAMVKHNNTMTGYVNGVAVGTNTTAGAIYQNTVDPLRIGILNAIEDQDLNGYIQDLRIYKGVAKYKGGFDVPKFYTPVDIGTWRAVPDTTANNFATWNPVSPASDTTFTNGNLTVGYGSSTTFGVVVGTVGVAVTGAGKYYWENRIDASSISPTAAMIGLWGMSTSTSTANHPGNTNTYGWSYYGNTGNLYSAVGGALSNLSYGATYTTGDIIGVSLDMTTNNGSLEFYKNGVSQGVATTGIGTFLSNGNVHALMPALGDGSSPNTYTTSTNFGQNPTFSGNTTAGTYTDSNGKGLFKYQPPSGFLALCEDNLPTPAIKNPGEHFKTVLYTADGNTRSITGIGFQPDLVWIKSRNAELYHLLTNSVTGVDNTLSTNTTDAESFSTERVLNSFDSDGFSLNVDDGSGYYGWNVSGQNMVAWCWKAGGATVSNTDGSINSVVSVNQDAGFSIVSYTGNSNASTTVGHGLGKKPTLMIVKERTATGTSGGLWGVSHAPTNTIQFLNLTSAGSTISGGTNGSVDIANATSTVFPFINGASSVNNWNNNGSNYIAYCWTEIEGFSKFGSYVGNGSADGPFVYCGFKPAFVMIKASSTSGDWLIMDSSRDSTNPNSLDIYANLSNTETNFDRLDFLSNGFKNRAIYSNNNGNGVTYIFAAFAESPFQTANAK